MTRFNKKTIMNNAWKMVKKNGIGIAKALKIAWANAKVIAMAKAKAGVDGVAHTWYGWKMLGYEVIHESKAMFKATVIDLDTKKGTRVLSFFGEAQVA